jgi:DNA-binding GntR family transcriptional regulator
MSSTTTLQHASLLTATRAGVVAERLRDEIMSGRLAPGTPLRQKEISEQFGVSTTPVREAFAALQREGLLVGDPHRGVVVFRPSIHDLRENYEMRIALESLAAAKAAEHITDEELAELDALLETMRHIADPLEYFRVNGQFHATIYAAAKRPRLADTIHQLRQAGYAYGNLFAVRMSDRSISESDHAAIVDALTDRSPQRAGEAMASHLQRNADFVAEQLEDSATH